MQRRAAPAHLLPLLVALAGCGATEPYARPGNWRPLGANADNLRAMLADPRDLDRGRGAPASDGTLAAAAVDRLRTDTVRPLPSSAVAEVKVNDAGAAAPPATPTAAAPPPAAPDASGAGQ